MRRARIITVTITACVLTACAPQEAPTIPAPTAPTPRTTSAVASPTPTTSRPSPTPSPSPSPSPSTSSDEETAKATVLTFFRIYDAIAQDPDASLQPLAEITDGEFRGRITELVDRVRSYGQYRSGHAEVRVLSTEDLQGEDGMKQVAVYACLNATTITTMDVKTRKPVIPDPKVPFTKWKLVVTDKEGWKISGGGNKKVESCN